MAVVLPPLAAARGAGVLVRGSAVVVASLMTWMAGRVGTAGLAVAAILPLFSSCAIERASGNIEGMPLSAALADKAGSV